MSRYRPYSTDRYTKFLAEGHPATRVALRPPSPPREYPSCQLDNCVHHHNHPNHHASRVSPHPIPAATSAPLPAALLPKEDTSELPTERELQEHRSAGFAKSHKTYATHQRKWDAWVDKNDKVKDKSAEWIDSDARIEQFIVYLERKKKLNLKTQRLEEVYKPSTLHVALCAVNAIRTTLGRSSILHNPAFPRARAADKRLKRKINTRKINKEESKSPEFSEEEIDSIYRHLPGTPFGTMCKLYLLLVRGLNHHSNKVIHKVVSDFHIDKHGAWVEIWRGADEKAATTKSKADSNSRVRLYAEPTRSYRCPVIIVRQHLQNMPVHAQKPDERVMRNVQGKKSDLLPAGPLIGVMGKNNVLHRVWAAVIGVIPEDELVYERAIYNSNSLRRANAEDAIAEAKRKVIESTLAKTHHAGASVNAYLKDASRNLADVQNAVLTAENAAEARAVLSSTTTTTTTQTAISLGSADPAEIAYRAGRISIVNAQNCVFHFSLPAEK